MLKCDKLKFGFKKWLNKRGISVMIGYILLVSIGLALSAMVFAWLMFYIETGDTAECPEGLSLSIRNVNCNSSLRILNFTVVNIGYFSVEGLAIKVNDKPSSNIGVFLVGENLTKIVPGERLNYSYSYYDLVTYDSLRSQLTLLELQPLVNVDGKNLYCTPTVKEYIECF